MKKVVALLLSIVIVNAYFCQDETKKQSKMIFGFSLGINHSNIIIPESPIPNGGALKNGTGFELGVIMETPLSERVSILPKAELAFRAGQINFDKDPDGLQSIGVMSTTIDAMVHFNFRIAGNKLSPYVLLGPNFSYNVRDRDVSKTQFSSTPNLSIDMGFGFNKAFEHFSFAPELRYSFGLFNVNNNPVLSEVYAHSVTLAFNFKG